MRYLKEVIDIETKHTAYKLKIADLYFDVTTFYDKHTAQMFKNYMVDTIDKDYPCYKINCTVTVDELAEPQGKKLTDREESNWYMEEEGVYNQSFYDFENECICALFSFDNNERNAEVVLRDMRSLFDVDTEVFLYNVLDRVFRLAIVFNSGFVFHASSVAHSGYGLAFSALSGVGKSTHTGLWLKHREGSYIINDDAPALRFIDGNWYIYGTPWAGTTGINTNVCLPLKSLVFLERSTDNHISDCSVTDGIRRIFEALIHPASDEISDIIFELIAQLFTNAKVCVLGCNISPEAVDTVEDYLF